MSVARFRVGDVFAEMAKIPDGSVDLIVTSPPFLALRSYLPADHPDKGKEIGSEATPAAFLSTLLALTREWRRILAPHGSLCVELGDTYSGSGGAGGDYNDGGLRDGQSKYKANTPKYRGYSGGSMNCDTSHGDTARSLKGSGGGGWPLPKSLCLLPTLYPASLAYGYNMLNPTDRIDPWRIRNQIVWHRPNPPVGQLGDKVRPSTSYITIACQRRDRWFDLDAERHQHSGDPAKYTGNGYSKGNPEGIPGNESMPGNPAGAPPLDYWQHDDDDPPEHQAWTIPTQPYPGAHYATFPIALPRRLIRLMCPTHVCRTCGEPRRRIVDVSFTPHGERRDENKGVRGGAGANGEHAQHMAHGRATKNVDTLGWSDCGHAAYRRGVVLDCFGGSGTTGAAAVEQGRDCILIDLDERNRELARQRIGLFLVDGDDEQPSPVPPASIQTLGGAHANG